MQANPNKFQLILFATSLQTGSIKIKGDITIESRTTVKLLGTYLDSKLRFKEHVSNLCNKANEKSKCTGFENTRYCKQVKHCESFILCYNILITAYCCDISVIVNFKEFETFVRFELLSLFMMIFRRHTLNILI